MTSKEGQQITEGFFSKKTKKTKKTKYEFTEATHPKNKKARRIRALVALPKHRVQPGDLGGYIESEENLSHDGDCWVADNAQVSGHAKVFDDALVAGNAVVSGGPYISNDASVLDSAQVYGNAEISDSATVSENARVYLYSVIYERCTVMGNARVSGWAGVRGRAIVKGDAFLAGRAIVEGKAIVGGKRRLTGKEIISEGTTMKEEKDNDMDEEFDFDLTEEEEDEIVASLLDTIDDDDDVGDGDGHYDEVEKLRDLEVSTGYVKKESVLDEGAAGKTIEDLRKVYEPLRGKKIDHTNATKLRDTILTFDDNISLLKKLVKAHIPFVSRSAASRLLFQHNTSPAEVVAMMGEAASENIQEDVFRLDGRRREFREKIRKLAYEKAKKMVKSEVEIEVPDNVGDNDDDEDEEELGEKMSKKLKVERDGDTVSVRNVMEGTGWTLDESAIEELEESIQSIAKLYKKGRGLRETLVSAVTEYDRKQSKKKFYSIYALPQYLGRVDEVVRDVDNGATVRSAIVAGFTGPLENFILKAVGEPKATDAEQRGGLIYKPVTEEATEDEDVTLDEAKRKSKKDYEIYHTSYTSALSEVLDLIVRNGYTVNPDNWFNKVSTGPRKPSNGKTNSFVLELDKDGKETRRTVAFQVYGLESGRYELNAYIS